MPGLPPPVPAPEAAAALWHAAGLPGATLSHLVLTGDELVLPSSFAVATAAQTSLGVAALAATELWYRRQQPEERQDVRVPREHATLESSGYFTLDGQSLQPWDKLAGLYACGTKAGERGWVRLHTNFAHHRDGVLALLGFPSGPATERAAVAQALRRWKPVELESAAADAGLVLAAARSLEAWDAHPQGQAVAAEPVVSISRLGDAPPLPWPVPNPWARPLHGLRVLDLTRILAGPVAGRTLAAYGADVMLVNSPTLPNIEAIAETSRGKLSTHIDLRDAAGQATLRGLVGAAHVFLQAYRPGGMTALGFGPEAVAALRPGIVYASLSAYGPSGPWAGRRGFDSLVQTATGFNLAEGAAAGNAEPKALPLQILDYSAGYLLAFGIQAALWRQAQEGGSWHVQVSLAGAGHWLRSLGRVTGGLAARRSSEAPYLQTEPSGFGLLGAVRHAAEFSQTPPAWVRPSMPPGSHPPVWPEVPAT